MDSNNPQNFGAPTNSGMNPITPLSQPKSNKLVFVLVGLVIIAGLIFACMKYRTTSPQALSEDLTTNPSVTDSKQYVSEDYGFEFNYPATSDLQVGAKNSVPAELFRVNIRGAEESYIGVSVWDNSKQLSLVDWTKANSSFSNYSSNATLKNETFSGHKAISYSWAGMSEGKTVLIENGKFIILLDTMRKGDAAKYLQDFSSVLASFEITNPASASTPDNKTLLEFSDLTSWEITNGNSEWRAITLDQSYLAKYPSGSVTMMTKTFNGPPGFANPAEDLDKAGKAEDQLIAAVKARLSQNGWKLVASPNEAGFYQDYLYEKNGKPLVFSTGGRDAVIGGMYVSLQFLK